MSGAVYPATERNIQEDLNLVSIFQLHSRYCLKFATLLPLTLMLGACKSNSANFGPYSALILNSLKYTVKLFSP